MALNSVMCVCVCVQEGREEKRSERHCYLLSTTKIIDCFITTQSVEDMLKCHRFLFDGKHRYFYSVEV